MDGRTGNPTWAYVSAEEGHNPSGFHRGSVGSGWDTRSAAQHCLWATWASKWLRLSNDAWPARLRGTHQQKSTHLQVIILGTLHRFGFSIACEPILTGTCCPSWKSKTRENLAPVYQKSGVSKGQDKGISLFCSRQVNFIHGITCKPFAGSPSLKLKLVWTEGRTTMEWHGWTHHGRSWALGCKWYGNKPHCNHDTSSTKRFILESKQQNWLSVMRRTHFIIKADL